MKKTIIFVGGVHGVGKTTFCQRLAAESGYSHFAASSLIKQKKETAISTVSKNVTDIPSNQELLLEAISDLEASIIILDGHFTIPDKNESWSGNFEIGTVSIFSTSLPE